MSFSHPSKSVLHQILKKWDTHSSYTRVSSTRKRRWETWHMQGLIKGTMNNCLLLHGQLIISQPHNLLHFLRPTGQNSTGFSRNLVDVKQRVGFVNSYSRAIGKLVRGYPIQKTQGCNNLVTRLQQGCATTLLQPGYRYAIDTVTTL